jgi:hypothetical protein
VESHRSETQISFLLTAEEREALARILRVAEDEWWLDDLEQALLQRLEHAQPQLSSAA